jgi:hypothetical protein
MGDERSSNSNYIVTDGESGSSSWCQASSVAKIRFVLLLDICCLPSLTRGRVCNLLVQVGVILGLKPEQLMTTSYCLI